MKAPGQRSTGRHDTQTELGVYTGSWHGMHMHATASAQCQLSSPGTSTEYVIPIQLYWLARKPQVSPCLHLTFAETTVVIIFSPFHVGSRSPNLGPYVCVTNALLAEPTP